MQIFAEGSRLLNLSVLEPKDKTPLQIKPRACVAPAAVVINYVIVLRSDDERLGMKCCLGQLIEKGENFINSALLTHERMMPGNAPNDVICHDASSCNDVLVCLCSE